MDARYLILADLELSSSDAAVIMLQQMYNCRSSTLPQARDLNHQPTSSDKLHQIVFRFISCALGIDPADETHPIQNFDAGTMIDYYAWS